LAAVILGATQLAVVAFDAVSAGHSAARIWEAVKPGWRPALYMCLVGGKLYLLAGLTASLKPVGTPNGRPQPFDFRGTFGPHIMQETQSHRLRRWLLGIACIVVGVPIGTMAEGLTRKVFEIEIQYTAIIVLVRLVAVSVMITGCGLLAHRADSVLRRNRRRPVLYLRSFGADVGLFSGVCELLTQLFFNVRFDHPERALARALKGIGPLVAIGRPGEPLPPLGAARLYVRDDWQRVVAGLAQASELVIFRIGRTPGFWWEVQHVLSACDPRRVLIYLPKKDRSTVYSAFRERSAAIFPQPLPHSTGQALFLGFDADWTPRPFGIRGPSGAALWRRFFGGGRAPAVREALNLALRPLGRRTRRLPLSWQEWLALFISAALLFQCCGCILPLAARDRVYQEYYMRESDFR
jgi:hypothetical protein